MGTKKINLNSVSPEEREIIEARRAYKKAWRAANKDRVAEYNRRFWLKKAGSPIIQSIIVKSQRKVSKQPIRRRSRQVRTNRHKKTPPDVYHHIRRQRATPPTTN